MPDDFYREVTVELKKAGYLYWKAAKGSHEKWRQGESGPILIVPRHLKSRHTANAILKDAGSAKRV